MIALFIYEAAYSLIHCAEIIEVPRGVESARTWLTKVATRGPPKNNIILLQNNVLFVSPPLVNIAISVFELKAAFFDNQGRHCILQKVIHYRKLHWYED